MDAIIAIQDRDISFPKACDETSTQLTLDTGIFRQAQNEKERLQRIEDEVASLDSMDQIVQPTSFEGAGQSDWGTIFVGRDRELYALQHAYQQHIVEQQQQQQQQRCCNSHQEDDARNNQQQQRRCGTNAAVGSKRIPAVLIWGSSGTGKSRLVQQFLKRTIHSERKSSSSKQKPSSDNTTATPSTVAAANSRYNQLDLSDDDDDDDDDSRQSDTDFINDGSSHNEDGKLSSTPRPISSDHQTLPPLYAIHGKYEGPRVLKRESALIETTDGTSSADSRGSKRDDDDENFGGKSNHRSLSSSPSSMQDPFSALNQAFSDFCQQVIQGPIEERRRFRNLIRRSRLFDQRDIKKTLLDWVPSLSIIMDEDGDITTNHEDDKYQTEDEKGRADSESFRSVDHPTTITETSDTIWNRFQYTVQRFLKAIATPERPIVLILDDLQWSSSVSMDLLSTILLDPDLHNFLFMGCIRQHDEQVKDGNPAGRQKDSREVLRKNPESIISDEKTPPRPADGVETAPERPDDADHGEDRPQQEKREAKKSVAPSTTLERLRRKRLKKQALQKSKLPVPENCPSLTKLLHRFGLAQKQWHTIQLSYWNKSEILVWLSTILRRSCKDLEPIAEHLHVKTKGNILFAQQLLEEYKRSKIVYYSRARSQWDWNLDGDESNNHYDDEDIPLCDKLIDLIGSKIKQLDPKMQSVLVIASYIRYTFDLQTLYTVVDYETIHGIPSKSETPTHPTISVLPSRNEIVEVLENAVLQGLLANTLGGSTYRFTHDRIQQAAHDLIPVGPQRDALRLRVGMCLLQFFRRWRENQRDSSLLFIAADHLNGVMTNKDNLFLMALNLEVGEKALLLAALGPAATYLRLATKAMKRIPRAWNNHYDIVLRVHRARADVELSLGRFQSGYDIGQVLLSNAKQDEDRFPTYLAMAAALGRQNRHAEGLEMSKRGVQMLGEYPARWFAAHATKEHLSVQSYFRRHSDEEFLRLPLNTDPVKLLAMKFMTQILIRSFICQNYLDWMLAGLRMIQLTIRTGLCEHSGMALVNYSLLVAIKGDQAAAARYARLGEKILDRVDGKAVEGWVYFTKSTYVDSWTENSTDIARSFRLAHSSAMENGEFEVGFLSWHMANMSAYWDGFDLGMLQLVGESMLEQMNLYKVISYIGPITEQQNMVKIMAGKIPLEWNRLRHYDKQMESSDAYYPIYWNWTRLHIAVYFFQMESAEKFAKKMMEFAGDEPGYHVLTTRLLLTGIMAAARYRKSRKRKYMLLLRKMYKQSKKLNKTRGMNSRHRTLLLQAEYASISDKDAFKRNKDLYDQAIQVAKDTGHIHEAGFGCELAGEYLLDFGLGSMVKDYFTRAYTLYKQWGGAAKIDFLKKHRRDHLDEAMLLADQEVDSGGIITQEEATIATNPSYKYELISVCSPLQPAMQQSATDSGSSSEGFSEEPDCSEDDASGEPPSSLVRAISNLGNIRIT